MRQVWVQGVLPPAVREVPVFGQDITARVVLPEVLPQAHWAKLNRALLVNILELWGFDRAAAEMRKAGMHIYWEGIMLYLAIHASDQMALGWLQEVPQKIMTMVFCKHKAFPPYQPDLHSGATCLCVFDTIMKYETVKDKTRDRFDRYFRVNYLHGHSFTKLLSVTWQTVAELITLISSYNPLGYDALLLVWPITEIASRG